MSFDFLSAIKNIAPILAGTFGTPLLGLAVKSLCTVIPDQAPALQAAHTSDPVGGALGKLGDLLQSGAITTDQIKQAELAHASAMAELGYKNMADLAAITEKDRDSARKAGEKSNMPQVLATVAIGGFLVCMAIMAIGAHIDDKLMSPFLMGFGALIVLVKDVYGFTFGSSASSKTKDDTINSLSNQ